MIEQGANSPALSCPNLDHMPHSQFVLTLSCPDRPGIVSAVSTFLAQNGQNILDAQQFDDIETSKFFMRVVFTAADLAVELSALRTGFAAIAQRFAMDWQMRDRAAKRRVMLLASKSDHCLVDILYRWRTGELDMVPTAVVSNHPRETYTGIHSATSRSTICRRPGRTSRSRRPIETGRGQQHRSGGAGALHADPVGRYVGKALRTLHQHPPFLPAGLQGRAPYHQAHERGVKLIGATAHYVTRDLDEGPIIDQAVERISHRDSPDDLVRKGRDIERRVLARALAPSPG